MAPVKHGTIIAELKATIETMRSQYTDLLLCHQRVEAELQKQVERREEEKLRAVNAEAEMAALHARRCDIWLSH